jgi:hypothetical protein
LRQQRVDLACAPAMSGQRQAGGDVVGRQRDGKPLSPKSDEAVGKVAEQIAKMAEVGTSTWDAMWDQLTT